MKKSLKLGAILTCILSGLTSPTYAKMYNPGLETSMEKKYNLDLIGDFSGKEVEKIGYVMDKVDEKIDRKEKRIKYFTIKKTKDLKCMGKDCDGAACLTEKTIELRDNIKENYLLDKYSLPQFKKTLAHEIGHLVYNGLLLSNDEIFNEPWKNPFISNKAGFISDYAKTGDSEDFAETFSEWISNENYNSKNKAVKEKINFLKEFVGKKYPKFSP